MSSMVMPYEPPKYPLSAFHLLARQAGYEMLHNIQAPDAMIGMSMVAGMTLAVHGLADVKLPTGQIRPTSINVLSIGESGERKTSVDGCVFAAVYERDMLAAKAHKSLLEDYRLALQQWESKRKWLARRLDKASKAGQLAVDAILADMEEHAMAKPKKPRLRRYMHENITPRSIMDALEGDGECIAIASDEAQVMFQGGAMTQLGLLNKAWDGARLMTLDRADMIHVLAMNPRVTINIMTQKEVLLKYLETHGVVSKGSGHWARYLVGWPVSTQGFRWVMQGELVWKHLPFFQQRMKVLLDKYDAMAESGEIKRELIEFSEDAKARWFNLARKTEWMLRPGDYLHDINDFASKVMEILGRLAAVLHYFNGEQGQITLDTLERAFEIIQWHVDEYKRLFSPQFVMPQDQVDANEVAIYLRNFVWQGPDSKSWIAKNHLLRNGPARSSKRLDAALHILEKKYAVWIGKDSTKRRFVNLYDAFFAAM